LARSAWGGFMKAAREMAEQGTFTEFAHGYSGGELNKDVQIRRVNKKTAGTRCPPRSFQIVESLLARRRIVSRRMADLFMSVLSGPAAGRRTGRSGTVVCGLGVGLRRHVTHAGRRRRVCRLGLRRRAGQRTKVRCCDRIAVVCWARIIRR